MMFEIDFKRLVAMLLPTALRRPLIFGLLRAGVEAVERVNSEFKSVRAGHIFRLTHNGQVCYLRGALNERFGPGFRIYDMRGGGEWLYAITENGENIPLSATESGNDVPILYRESQLNEAQNDFEVCVPARCWDRLEEIKAMVDSYKLVTKRAHYRKISNPINVTGYKQNNLTSILEPIYLLKK